MICWSHRTRTRKGYGISNDLTVFFQDLDRLSSAVKVQAQASQVQSVNMNLLANFKKLFQAVMGTWTIFAVITLVLASVSHSNLVGSISIRDHPVEPNNNSDGGSHSEAVRVELVTPERGKILKNLNVSVWIKCTGNSPTEWVGNFYDELDNELHLDDRNEWSSRRVRNFSDPNTYEYTASIKLDYNGPVIQEVSVLCRSIANHSNNIMTKITPIPLISAGYLTAPQQPQPQVEVSLHPDWPVSAGTPVSECMVTISVAQVDGYYYWRCERFSGSWWSSPDKGGGKLGFYVCDTAANCANSRRDFKERPQCVTVFTNLTLNDLTREWKKQELAAFIPGTFACTLRDEETGQVWVGATEYFFEGKDMYTVPEPPRKMRTSLLDIQMKDLMWMEPAPRREIYYTNETLDVQCIVPKYGFAFGSFAIVTRNGSQVMEGRDFEQIPLGVWGKRMKVNLSEYGPGTYQVQCIAPVWNTPEWANYTTTTIVETFVPPHFASNTENVTLQIGAIGEHLRCDALGNPPPDSIHWDTGNIPGARPSLDDSILTLPGVYEGLNGVHITCTVKNKFGGHATKWFKLHVAKSFQVPTTTIVIVVLSLLVFTLALASGFYIFNLKFKKLNGAIKNFLSDDEVKDFIKGKKKETRVAVQTGSHYLPLTFEGEDGEPDDEELIDYSVLPYNSNLEVPKENFNIDFSKPLGSGEYGVVYKGFIKQGLRDESPIPVAVKTVRVNVQKAYFKTLLAELKILAHIGQHENVLHLIGAYTGNIKNMELYVGVELCKTSLIDFLTENRPKFELYFAQPVSGLLEAGSIEDSPDPESTKSVSGFVAETSFIDDRPESDTMTMTTAHLIQWAREIAAGMEFLGQSRLLHGDLAARNVLLTFGLHAKIGDFGLARQLIDYTYIKSHLAQQCPLPWKWMAIEALAQMTFSTKSDVWSYGVTLWELFSIGDVPYAGMALGPTFVNQLYNGLRLNKPNYASNAIFEVMQRCWHKDPKQRPRFSDLKKFFKSLE